MKDEDNTKEQLLKELIESRQRIAVLEETKAEGKKTEERLMLFSQGVEGFVDAVAMGDLEGRITYVNKAFVRTFGYSREELIGKEIAFIYPEDQLPKLEEAIKATMEGGWTGELVARRKNGELFPIGVSSSVVVDDEGEVTAHMANHRDITERRQREEQLRKLSAVVEQSSEGMAIADLEGNISFVNKAWVLMHGYASREELAGQNLKVFHDQEQLEQDVIPFNEEVKKKGFHRGEVGHIRRDGTPFPTLMTTTILKDEEGNPCAIVGIAKDITERVQAEETLRASERKYRTLIESSHEVVFRKDRDGHYHTLNLHAAIGLGGTCIEDVVGKTDYDLLPKEQADVLRRIDKQIMESGKDMEIEEVVRNAQGEDRIYLSHKWPTYDDEGRITGIACFAMDITERKHAEEALCESEEKFRIISSSAHDAVIVMDGEERVSYWNKAAEKMFGHSNQEILGKHLHFTLSPQRYHEAYKKGFSQFRTTGKGASVGKTLELAALKKDGTEFPIELSMSAFTVKSKWNAIGIVRDITERKKAEEELRKRNEELEMFNKMTVGRELRMVELKNEINVLLEELGREPRYRIAGESVGKGTE